MWTKEFPGGQGYYWIRWPANLSYEPEVVLVRYDYSGTRLLVQECDVEEAAYIEDYFGEVEWQRIANPS